MFKPSQRQVVFRVPSFNFLVKLSRSSYFQIWAVGSSVLELLLTPLLRLDGRWYCNVLSHSLGCKLLSKDAKGIIRYSSFNT